MDKKGRKPDFIAKSVTGEGDKNYWNDIGVVFWNEESKTFSVYLNALPVNGKLVLCKPQEKKEKETPKGNPYSGGFK